MKTFVDSASRNWTINLTIDAVKRVKGLVGVDLLDIMTGDPPVLTRLGTDIMLLCDVIFALVKPQADEESITDEQFGASLGGDAILAAQSAFYDELTSFFLGMGRKDVVKAVTVQRTVIEKAVEQVTLKIQSIDLDKILADALREIPG